MKLDADQTRAVNAGDGPLLILAGPGAGKTAVLTHRVAALLERGVAPEQILLLTFTQKAAREMSERVREQVFDAQSSSRVHPPPTGQPSQRRPPQSRPVSSPLTTSSSHRAAWQIRPFPLNSQTPLTQSSASTQRRASPQGSHPPPQSTSVSSLFLTPSSQRASAHSPLVHRRLTQSVATLHAAWAAQGPQAPPQSTSDSSPFWRPSSQRGAATQRPVSSSQTPLSQS